MIHYTRSCQKGEFEAGLCGCCGDCGSCCYVYWCYPCALAQAWADARGESCSCCHIHAYEIFVKANIRQARGMRPEYCQDWCANAFCPCCSLIQDMREISFIRTESRIRDQSSTNVVINYTNSSDNFINNNNNQGPPQHPYGIPQNFNNNATNQYSSPHYSPQPYVPPVYPPSQNFNDQPYPSQPYAPPQLYPSPQFVDDSKHDGNTPSDQS